MHAVAARAVHWRPVSSSADHLHDVGGQSYHHDIPIIGIGAGPHCDGQVLVFHDLLGIEDRVAPKFVRRYASLKEDAVSALRTFADDVRTGRFPDSSESYHLSSDQAEALGLYGSAPTDFARGLATRQLTGASGGVRCRCRLQFGPAVDDQP